MGQAPGWREKVPAGLPQGLVQADTGGDRDVQALDRTGHRDAHQLVAGLAGELAQAVALGTEHQRERAGQVDVVDRALGVVAGADDPEVALLQLVEAAREVGHHQVGHRLGRAAGDLGHRRVDAHRVVLRRHYRVRAGAIGHAQAGAEVVGVGDAVEHQHQRHAVGGLDALHHRIERMQHRDLVHARDHALVAAGAGELVQAVGVAVDQLHAGVAGALQELPHPRIAPVALVVQLEDRAGCGLHPHGDGMEAEEDAICAHPGIVRYIRASSTRPINTGWWTM